METLKEPKTATFGTIILDLNLFDRSFLRQLASQLQYGAGGTLSHSILCDFGRFRLPWRQNGTKKPNVWVRRRLHVRVLRPRCHAS